MARIRAAYLSLIRMLPRALLLLAFALSATGCIGYEEHVTFTPGGAGTFQLKFGFDVTLLDSFGGMDSETRERGIIDIDREPLVEQFGEDVELEALSEQIDGRQYEGFRLMVAFPSAEQFGELTDAIAERAAERSDPNYGRMAAELALEVSGTIYTLTGMLPPFLGAEDKSGPLAMLIFSSSRRILKLTLPGQVLSSNADSREGQTYIWRLDPLATEGRPVSARWNAAGASGASADPVPARR